MLNIHDMDTVALDEESRELLIIDQTLLPGELKILRLKSAEDIWEAINLLRVRGAPAIGAAAAVGIYVLAESIRKTEFTKFYYEFLLLKNYLASSRPTAVNLSWALQRMESCLLRYKSQDREAWLAALKAEAKSIILEDELCCRALGEYGLTLLRDGDGVLTHCNAGKLATIKYGTATAPFYIAQERGVRLRIYADETRPLLQGARLTAFELSSAGMDVTLLCDNMAATLMKQGLINAVFTGCDRVAGNGDTANKIGTLGVAVLAKHFGIPFYIFAPSSTIDMATASGSEIIIEQRGGAEVTDMWYRAPMSPAGIKVINPAFDVTDAELITAIVTERGIAYPPFESSLERIMKNA